MRSLPSAAWTLFRLAEHKRGGTATHMWRVGTLAWRFAKSLELPAVEAQALGLAAALHDTGKLCIPNTILEKPGKLSPDETQVMRMHPRLGADMLRAIGGAACELAASVALTHHERYDGLGYPHGLSGNRIPLAGRIVAIVDVFDALASHRPYRDALSPTQIVGAMLGAAAPNAVGGYLLTVIAAIILGGTSLFGGRGSVWGTLLAVLILGTLNNGLTLLNVSSFWQDVTKGAVLLLAVGLDQLRVRVQN